MVRPINSGRPNEFDQSNPKHAQATIKSACNYFYWVDEQL